MCRTSRIRHLATILTLSLTLVCLASASRDASAYNVRKVPASMGAGGGGSYNGDPDAPGGSGLGLNGPTSLPRASLQPTSTRTTGEGAVASKMGWWLAIQVLLTKWGVALVR